MNFRYITFFLLTVLLVSCEQHPPYFQGYVEGENIYIASPNAGTLLKLFIMRGQVVKKGQLLGKLDPNPQLFAINEANASLMQAKTVLQDLISPKRPPEIAAINAQIKQAEAQIGLAAVRVKRNQTLVDKHALDKDTLDASIEHYEEVEQLKAQYMANLTLAKEGARVDQIKAQEFQIHALIAKLKQSRWELAQKDLIAPIDGVIFDTYFKEGEYVSAQRPIATLLAPEYIRIDFFVTAESMDLIHLGQQVEFTSFDLKHRHKAVINYISPEAEYVPPLVYSRDNNHKLIFRVKAKAENSKFVKPGQPIIVYITDPDHVS